MNRVPVNKGMLHFLIKQVRPSLASEIEKTGKIETVIIGLGRQGTKHAGLMKDFGTDVTAGVSKGRGGTRVQEVIPVYDNITECLAERPNIAVASIWRHYSGVRDVCIEIIKAGVPIIVLISEWIPLKDVRDILVAARKHGTLLFGGNTPGVIFPPEGIKVGMLPDVFYPEEVSEDECGPRGVTIISRSGAILYHLSDALASVGVAQNAVLGVGGDGAIGTRFVDIVPLVQKYPATDLIVVAGEIGGTQEELLAEDMIAHPEKYPKPVVALISGANAPAGKTMGHAGAIVTPGQEYGTFATKKAALSKAGVAVVNSQPDLIEAVQQRLGGKTYFEVDRYREKMRLTWEEPPKAPEWATMVTNVKPNNLQIAGYPLQEVIEKKTLLDAAFLLVKGELPSDAQLEEMRATAIRAATMQSVSLPKLPHENISETLARSLMTDPVLHQYLHEGKHTPQEQTAFCLGRVASYMANSFGSEVALSQIDKEAPFSHAIFSAITGQTEVDKTKAALLEALVTASVDHGVTPPSAQATVIAASVRAPYTVALAHGVGAITDVHGGAGAKAATFFKEAVSKSKESGTSLSEAIESVMQDYINAGRRVQGLGHRVHTDDPRRDALWRKAEQAGVAAECVAASKAVTEVFSRIRGLTLPINVDGVIGAIVADLGLEPVIAKAVFIFGRIAGLSAHYFEEIAAFPEMRQINFAQATYKGHPLRHID